MFEENYFNPFPGLRSFEEQEDVLFFGREKQVDELMKKLRMVKFLSVVGSSGSGKSSLVKSGLIPALYSGFMSGAGSSWRITTFRPGNDPIGNMARALAVPGVLYHPANADEEATFAIINETTLRRSSQGLVEIYKQSGVESKNNLLLLVDQFEEIFRFSKYEKDAGEGKRDSVAFINLLLRASEQKEYPVYVVFTMRSDFLGDCTAFRGLPEAINEGQYLVPRMTREERRDAITGPVAVGGATIAPRLLNQLLNDVGDNPDQLPVLQHALMRTWDVWKNKNNPDAPLDVEDYEQTGTMIHALSQHAEEAYHELNTPRKKEICEKLFKALTDRGSDSRGVRRPTRLSEICKLANASEEEVIEVINVFRQPGRSFLMPPAEISINGNTIIDISHESLMRCWDRFITWLDEENQSVETYLRLCEAANLYELKKGGPLRDPELQLAWKWTEQTHPNDVWAARYNNYFEKAMLFLDYSRKKSEQERQHKENLQRERLRRTRIIAGVISVIAIVAFLLAIYSFEQRNRADKQKQLAVAQRQEAIKQKKLAEASREDALQQKSLAVASRELAVKQQNIAEQQRKKALMSEQEAIRQKVIAEGQTAYAQRQKLIADANAREALAQTERAEQQTEKAVASEKVAVDEKKISTRLKDLAEARNIAYRATLLMNEGKADESRKLAVEAYQMNVQNNGPLQNNDIYNALQDNFVLSIDNKNQTNYHRTPVKCITGIPGSDIIFTASEAGALYVAKTNGVLVQPLSSLTLKQDIRSMAVSPDGKHLGVVAVGGMGFMLDISDVNAIKQEYTFVFSGIPSSIIALDNGRFLLASSLQLFLVSSDAAHATLLPVTGTYALAVGKTGKIYTSVRNKILVYDSYGELSANHVSKTYNLPSPVISMAVDNNEQYLAAGTYDGGVWINDIETNNTGVNLAYHKSSVNSVLFGRTPQGSLQLASASADQTIRLMDVHSVLSAKPTEDVLVLRGHNKWIYGLWYGSNGANLYSCGEDKKVIGWKSTPKGLYDAINNKTN